MKISKIKTVFFSPTKTTKTIVQAISEGIGIKDVQLIDITLPEKRENALAEFDDELVIIGLPVYYGRLPEIVVSYIKLLRGNNTLAVPVVVYGNRDYGDALLELSDILKDGGFKIFAAGSFIGEHSYSITGREIAKGRPDTNDLFQAREFGIQLSKKLVDFNMSKDISIPGNRPYVELEKLNMIKKLRKETDLTFAPETDATLCTKCGKCAEVCPSGAIKINTPKKVDKYKCIICFACIKNCPTEAKAMNESNFNSAIEQLKNFCQERKEPQFIL